MRPDCTPLKTCTKCGRELPATTEYFFAQKNPTQPLRAKCKVCHTRQANGRHKVPEVAEHLRKRAREKYSEDPESGREKCRLWREGNRETMRECGRTYSRKNPDKRATKTRNRKARIRGSVGRHTVADERRQYERQRGRCYWCGVSVPWSAKHVDHVIPVARGGSNGPENLVIACASCNLSKGAKLPHEFGGHLC
jgi:5-methylcytosine-specific restriction endonuclease McrA